MPFTPFHFGPGLLAKALLPRRLSFTSFVLTQVAIDCETLYHLARAEWPVHRQCHSVLGGASVGLVVAAGVVVARPVITRAFDAVLGPDGARQVGASSETAGIAAVVGGLVGGASHSLLDAIVHPDVSPLWPMVPGNQLFGLVSPDTMHVLCVAAGVVGVGWLWLGVKNRRLVV
jgi:hypothetical protein